jgi:putative hydrolase of the HAD superfamily
MTDFLTSVILRQSRPLEPVCPDLEPVLRSLEGIRAVLFDIYGTLLVSASGDIDAHQDLDKASAFASATAAVGLEVPVDNQAGVEGLVLAIHQAHERAHEQGIQYPEVDIREIWRASLAEWQADGPSEADPTATEIEQLALEYELRVNPVWPMPDALGCLRQLRENGQRLGLISNAQFYTPATFSALLGQSFPELGFEPTLQFFSYQFKQAKPGRYLYEQAAAALGRLGIGVEEALYVGNDMLKDILPAARVGFRTALFAGDMRSLRLREGDERVQGVEPDLVVRELIDLVRCLPQKERQ